MWGVLFTCLALRAVHLEMALTLNPDSAVMANRRSIFQRGYSETITCDNGTNLRGANEKLKEPCPNWKKLLWQIVWREEVYNSFAFHLASSLGGA